MSNLLAVQSLLAQSEIGQTDPGTNFLKLILWAAFLLIIVSVLISAIELVSEKNSVVIERLGKFHTIFDAGLHFRIPLIDQAVAELTLQIQQMTADVKVKTQDNVFVTLPVTVQYRVQPEKVREAHYEIQDPEQVIEALVLNEVKSTAAEMELEQVFASRDHIQDAVKNTLGVQLGQYGYEIINVVVDNPTLSADLETSFNNVMAAQRKQDAARGEAEAVRIRMMGEATAEAASLEIKGAAIVNFRNTIAEGNAEAIRKMTDGTTSLDAPFWSTSWSRTPTTPSATQPARVLPSWLLRPTSMTASTPPCPTAPLLVESRPDSPQEERTTAYKL